MSNLLHVKVTRNFGSHRAGDELAVEDTPGHRANIKAGLYNLQKVEQLTPPPSIESPKKKVAAPAPKAPKAPAKAKPKAKPKAR